MVTKPTPQTIRSAADQEVEEADKLASALEDAVRRGDDTVTLEDLDAAQKRTKWARLRRDGAEKKATARALELAREEYKQVLNVNLPAATADTAEEIEALLSQARPFLAQALELIGDQNRALYKVAAYASAGDSYREAGDGLEGQASGTVPGISWFAINGARYDYTPATEVVRALLRPLKPEIQVRSGGRDSDWLAGI